MNRTIKVSEACPEPTVNQRSYLSRLQQEKIKELEVTGGSLKYGKTQLSSIGFKSVKKIQINLGMRPREVESVGEEGTAQIIRSPIVKRGKSMSHSIDMPKPSKYEKNTMEPYNKLALENISLRQQLESQKEQLKIYQKTISDLSCKFEFAKTELFEFEEKTTQNLIENRKLNEENEKLMSMLRFFDNDSSSKGIFHEALEAKLLSIDQDREEMADKYNRVLVKYISNLQEFLACQDWILTLISSPFPKKEIQDCEEALKGRVERLQVEIVYYQSLLNSERIIEKSYCTSISSSILHSPSYSPAKTMKGGNFSPTQKMVPD